MQEPLAPSDTATQDDYCRKELSCNDIELDVDIMTSRSSQQPPTAAAVGAIERKSGRAAFTEDGRSIWEWQTATGVFTRTITDEQLASLEATQLRIEEVPAAHNLDTQSHAAVAAMRTRQRRSVSRAAITPKSNSVGVLQGLLRRLIA